MAAPVLIYSTRVCPYCVRAKALLDSKQVAYTEVMVDHDPGKLTEMMQKSGRRTVPQIFVGDRHVGGFDDLYMLDRSGGLDPLLAGG
ncbi:MAG TPA: glutaredoxin 3 [Gammaproteobacteria bacterium]|jgi:glutaredoxin 3|nr:glutaredoxin 3 [Gammaproteobacteria bacterium]